MEYLVTAYGVSWGEPYNLPLKVFARKICAEEFVVQSEIADTQYRSRLSDIIIKLGSRGEHTTDLDLEVELEEIPLSYKITEIERVV